MANIVLYVPLAFLECVWILGLRADSRFRRTLGVLFMFALCGGVAVAVEFTQIFFAPRTVSLNDLLAETLGTVVCRAIWDSDARLKEIGFDFFDTASGDACTLAPNRLW